MNVRVHFDLRAIPTVGASCLAFGGQRSPQAAQANSDVAVLFDHVHEARLEPVHRRVRKHRGDAPPPIRSFSTRKSP